MIKRNYTVNYPIEGILERLLLKLWDVHEEDGEVQGWSEKSLYKNFSRGGITSNTTSRKCFEEDVLDRGGWIKFPRSIVAQGFLEQMTFLSELPKEQLKLIPVNSLRVYHSPAYWGKFLSEAKTAKPKSKPEAKPEPQPEPQPKPQPKPKTAYELIEQKLNGFQATGPEVLRCRNLLNHTGHVGVAWIEDPERFLGICRGYAEECSRQVSQKLLRLPMGAAGAETSLEV